MFWIANPVKQRLKKAKICCYISLLSVLLSSFSAMAKVTLLVSEFPPYIEQQIENGGVMTQLVVEAFKRVNVASEVEFANGYEVEQGIASRRVLSFMWQKTEARLETWHYSDPLYVERQQFLTAQDFSLDVSHIYNLHGVKMALMKGQTYGSAIESFRHKLAISEWYSGLDLIEQVVSGKAALAIIEPMIAVDLLAKSGSIKSSSPMKLIDAPYFEPITYYLVCGKHYGNCVSHIKRFNQGLALLEQDGSKAKLLNKAEHL